MVLLYCGSLNGGPELARHILDLRMTCPQLASSQLLRSAVRYVVARPIQKLASPNWHTEVAEHKVDYNLDESGRALPLKLYELMPGLPDEGVAASLNAVDHCSDEVREWLVDPTRALRQKSEWPERVPRATLQVESRADWYEVAKHLCRLGILVPIDHEKNQSGRTAGIEWSLCRG